MKTRAEVIDYIRSVSNDLSKLADAHHWDMLAYLFKIAKLEADWIAPASNIFTSSQKPKAVSSALGFWDWDLTHDRMFGDERAAGMFNLDKDAGRRGAPIEEWKQAVHPDDVDYVTSQLMCSVETGSEYNPHFRVVTPDQTIRHVQANGRCLFDSQGRPTRFPGTVQQVPAQNAILTEVEIDVIMKRGQQTH